MQSLPFHCTADSSHPVTSFSISVLNGLAFWNVPETGMFYYEVRSKLRFLRATYCLDRSNVFLSQCVYCCIKVSSTRLQNTLQEWLINARKLVKQFLYFRVTCFLLRSWGLFNIDKLRVYLLTISGFIIHYLFFRPLNRNDVWLWTYWMSALHYLAKVHHIRWHSFRWRVELSGDVQRFALSFSFLICKNWVRDQYVII